MRERLVWSYVDKQRSLKGLRLYPSAYTETARDAERLMAQLTQDERDEAGRRLAEGR